MSEPVSPGNIAAAGDRLDRLAADRRRRVGQGTELVVLVLERVRVDAANADATLRREGRERPEVLDVVPRDVQCHGLRDPGVASDRGRVLDLLERIPRDAGLREHAEPRARVHEPPRRDLDGQLGRRPADAVEVGSRLHVHRHSRWKTSGILVWNPVSGSVNGSISSAISACQRAFASLPAIWLVNRSKSSTSR